MGLSRPESEGRCVAYACASGPGRPAVETARDRQQGAERGGQRRQARGKAERISRTAVNLRDDSEGRLRHTRRVGDKIPRDRFRAPQYPEHETADRVGPAGGTLGQGGQRDEKRHDAPQRPLVSYRCIHVRPHPLLMPLLTGAHCPARAWGVNKISQKSRKSLILLEVVPDFIRRKGADPRDNPEDDGRGTSPRMTLLKGLH